MVEHDANEIWSTQLGVATEAILKAGLTIHDIASIGITNQRETAVVWDRKTSQPVTMPLFGRTGALPVIAIA
jgi:glycerol kinase